MGKCAVCGATVEPKLGPDGKQLRARVKVRQADGSIKRERVGTLIFTKLDAHHLLPKERYPEFAHTDINGICLCPAHHKYDRYSFHRNPVWAVLWLRQNRPEQFNWCKQHMGTHDSRPRKT